MAEHERQEPAISGYDMRYDDPRMNPIAFLPVDGPDMETPSGFAHDDGSVYIRPDPTEFAEVSPWL